MSSIDASCAIPRPLKAFFHTDFVGRDEGHDRGSAGLGDDGIW
jgi:hypothetical protein